MFNLSPYQSATLLINLASFVVLGIIAYFQLKISRRDIEKPNLEAVSYIRKLRDDENELTQFSMKIKNEGPGDAKDIKIRSISFSGFNGERSPENPFLRTFMSTELIGLSKTHVGANKELSIETPIPEGESEDRPNKIDRITVTLETSKTIQKMVFCNDRMPSRKSTYEGKSEIYSSDASIPYEVEVSKRPIIND